MDSMQRVTFSRSYTIGHSQTGVHAPNEVIRQLDHAARRGAKEFTVPFSESPEASGPMRESLSLHGHEDFIAYVVWACERALERGLLAHANIGGLDSSGLGRLRQVTASQGLNLETIRPRPTAHGVSPTRRSGQSLETLRSAGVLRIPLTTTVVFGAGEAAADRTETLRAIAAAHSKYGHIQAVVLHNGTPNPGPRAPQPAPLTDTPPLHGACATSVIAVPQLVGEMTLGEMGDLVRACRELMPGVGVQIPRNLSDWWLPLLRDGITDLGGLASSSNFSDMSAVRELPSVHAVRKALADRRFALTERLATYADYLDPEWMEQGVLDVVKQRFWSFIPRRGSGRRAERVIRRDLLPAIIDKAVAGRPLAGEELTVLFAENRPEAIEDIRQGADALRRDLAGETVTFVVNRNINVSNICIVGCAFCGFGRGRRSPDAYEHDREDFVLRVQDAVAYGATEICMQSGIHPDWGLEEYLSWLRLAKQTAPQLHLHAYSPMEVAHMCDVSGLAPAEVFLRLRDAGLGSTPGTAAEVLHDGVRQRISPNKLPVARWVEIIEASHAAGLRSTATVMFGHIEEPWELAEHMLVVRKLQERTRGITEFVPLSFIPFQTMLGRTHGIQEISRAESLKHTAAFRLALGRSINNLQASWVKMGLEAATEALRWGVNDLGGTLMEESISRLAGSAHGVRLDPDQLIGAAHAAGRPAAERTTLYDIRHHWPVDVKTHQTGSALMPAN